MCGIHGIYRFDGLSVEPRMLSSMGDRIRHRGPDDEGSHVDGPCGIGMRRLSIIDLAGGHQPLSNVDGSLWLVCDGEIYNFRELRSELQGKGYHFKSGSDAEVLLHLYDAEGDDFVLRLNGMFDFALWDVRRRRLLIGRDRLGVKPLYVLQDWQRLAFASEAKALLALPGVSAELDHGVVADYLHLGYVAAPGCIFKDIRKLPPATLLAVEDGEVREWRYWRLSEQIISGVSESQWIERVKVQLDESVRMQMVSDVPIGAFLSGGVESSAVLGLMARHSEQPIRTYAIGFSGAEAEALYNELPYARQMAKLFASEHREIVVQPDVVALLPKLLWHMDEPLSNTAFITTYLVSEFARGDVKVILSGVGGDELFGGYRRYLGGHYVRRYRRWPGWLRRAASLVARRFPASRNSGVLNDLRLAKGFMASAEMSFDERYRSYLQVLSRRHVSALLLDESAASASDPLARAFAAAGNEDELNRMLAVDAETQLPDDLLLLTDKMSMAMSLECRVPFLDHQLVELAAAMPASIKVRDGRLKHLLKASLADLLPDDILSRKKRGFGTPMGAWLKRELAPLLKRLLAAEVVEARGLFSHTVVKRLMADHAANRIDGTDILLAMMNLEIWSRIFLDRRDPADVAEELKSYVG
ncbi:asparagine synthase (glutamine-hydrolyzing) [Accumulibacter sp.]|uniref:asparagine synthase (glutamine-hydrolyzing) n=1 Tax=Accumulibacter sp. TaxID=2053492 RepID=UPI002D0469AB|nr:asparagine synthase (glutamine-hydrolyzing) [Accumulibacter sp.]HRF03993.1 asparagine synthase (glutamine-hydrolyzing) [Accumulibacter sp.]